MTDSDQRSRRFRSSFPSEVTDDTTTGFRTASWKYGTVELPEELEPLHATLVAALLNAATIDEGRGITLLAERERKDPTFATYRSLWQRSLKVAEGLRRLGVERKDRVLLVLPTSFDFVVSFFGTLLLGAIPAPAYPPGGLRLEAGMRRLTHIATDSEAVVCVTWDLAMPLLGDLGLKAPQLRHVVTAESLQESKPLADPYEPTATDRAFVQYTSGSTGNPKGVVLTHDNLICNIHSIGQALQINRRDVVVSWCPLYHDMGLIGGLLFSIYWRLPMVLMSPQAFLARPHRWLRAISDYRGTLSPAPNFGYALAVRKVSDEQREGLDLSSWRVALNGAEPVNLGTLRSFEETYAPYGFGDNVFLPVYGLAEASLAVAFPTPGAPITWRSVDREELAQGRVEPAEGAGAMTIVSTGKAVPGQSVMVLDEYGQFLDEGEVGHIIAMGRSIMQGYLFNDEATDKVLDGDMLWTGDLGFKADGELYVTGRAKDLIIVRGKNYYAEDLERAAEQLSGVRGGGAVAFSQYDEQAATDRVIMVCETKETDPEVREQLAGDIACTVVEECGLQVDEVVIVDPGTIPKTSSGKRQRSRCRDQYLKGTLSAGRTSKVGLGVMYLKSQVGYFVMQARKLFGG